MPSFECATGEMNDACLSLTDRVDACTILNGLLFEYCCVPIRKLFGWCFEEGFYLYIGITLSDYRLAQKNGKCNTANYTKLPTRFRAIRRIMFFERKNS